MNTTLFRMLRFFALALCTLILSMNAKTVPAAEPAVGGQWNQGPTFDDYPIHMHVLPTGSCKFICLGSEINDFGVLDGHSLLHELLSHCSTNANRMSKLQVNCGLSTKLV